MTNTTVSSQQLALLIAQRRSVRDFKEEAITLEQVLDILNAGQVLPATRAYGCPFSTSFVPLQLQVIARNVVGLEPAMYVYHPESHELVSVGGLPAEGDLLDASLASDFWLEDAPCVVVIAAQSKKALEHFSAQDSEGQQRGQRYVDFEAGAVSQTMHLQALCHQLGAIVVMGIDEQALKQTLQFAEDVDAVAAVCVGHAAES